MGEKELLISTHLPIEYVERDEEALETSFQALEIVVITNAEMEEGGSKLSRVAIIATKVLISNGLQLGKGLGKELDGIAEPIALQENLGRFELGYTGSAKERRPRLLGQERLKLQSGAEELEIINLDEEGEVREIQVGKQMPPDLRLPLIPNAVSVWYQFRRMKLEVALKIKEEAEKQWNAGLVVIPFGLKNVGATYQRAMVTLFHDMMHKEVEVYVDDMNAKSRMPDQHVEYLRKLFERLRKYKLRLNPTKCTFGVKIEKLLGFIVNERGIKVDQNKVKAIWNMSPLRMEIEVRGFLGRVNYIARLIS
ncbi:Retrovirus-related Pol polyprotein from transposon 17.6, partial [Mucuna pruriens]